jgi:ferric enterobactin receptor
MRIVFLLLIAAITSVTSSSAQQIKISGSVTDSVSNKAIEFATVGLLKSGKIIEGTSSDTSGKFVFTNVQNGRYSLQISVLGYATKTVNSCSLISI